jgi:hypothetical protein
MLDIAMSESQTTAGAGLFLSYNHTDHQAVLAIRRLLELRGLRTFLDRDHLAPGLLWPQALEQALKSSRAVAVFLGPHDLGLWQKREMFFALDLQVQFERENRRFPVIPVLLRDAQPQMGFLFQNTWVDFRDTTHETEALEMLIRSIERNEGAATQTTLSICPYLGLRAFEEEDQAFYFGREAFVAQLVQKVGNRSIVVVVGPSGSGKSSVVLAGLLPRLRRHRSPLVTWDAITFTPGDNPWWNLAHALVPLLEPNLSEIQRVDRAGILAEALRKRNGALAGTFRRALEISHGTGRLLVVVDQFEEMFTLAPGEKDLEDAGKEAKAPKANRACFLEDMLAATRAAPVTIVFTLRADYYSHALNVSRELSDALNTGQVALGPMLPDELRQAVIGPSLRVGVEFEPGLVNRILNDVGHEPGRLPLLGYTLKLLWDRRNGRTLTAQAYDALNGVTGAIKEQADSIYEALSDAEKNACRALLGRLIHISPAGTEGSDTRLRTGRSEIGEAGWQIALKLAAPDVRLLVIARDLESGGETAEVAHEAMIRGWKKLGDWLQEDRSFLLWRQQLKVFLSNWLLIRGTAGSVGEEALLRGPALDKALNWWRSRPSDLNAPERDFIAASRDARLQSFQRRLWIRGVAIAIGILILIGWAFWYEAGRETKEAQLIVDSFHQGAGHEKEEYDALWRLATSRSDRTIRAMVLDFLSTPDSASKFNEHSEAIRASLGLREPSLDALKGLSGTGPCATLWGEYISACSTIAQLSGDQESLANRIVELLAKARGDEAASLGAALAALASQLNGDQAERGGDRILELLSSATGQEACTLGSALAALAHHLKGNQAELGADRIVDLLRATARKNSMISWQLDWYLSALVVQLKGDQARSLADHIVGRLGKTEKEEAASLGKALESLATQLDGDQAQSLISRIIDRLDKDDKFSFWAERSEGFGSALPALATQLKGDQPRSMADRIVGRLGKAKGTEAASLARALPALTNHVVGNETQLANRIVELLAKARGDEAASLGAALAALASQLNGDQAERGGDRIVELLLERNANEVEAEPLAKTLAELASHLKGHQAERGANRIVERLGTSTDYAAASLGGALAALATYLKSDQAERAANRIVELLADRDTNKFNVEGLAKGLAALASQLKGDQAERGANSIIDHLDESSGLLIEVEPLNTLVAQLRDDQAQRLEKRVVERLGLTTGHEAEGLGNVLAVLIAQLNGYGLSPDALVQFLEQRRAMPCDVAVSNVGKGELPLLIDMLKWPVCKGRDGIMLRIAELRGTPPTEFGEFKESGKRSTFNADLRRFVGWLKTELDSDGKPFDVDEPPIWSAGHPKRAWPSTSKKR